MAASPPKTVVNQLFMLLKTAQIHDPSNQAFRTPLEQFQKLLTELIGREGIARLESLETNLYFNEKKLRSDISTFPVFRHFSQEFERKNVGGIAFLSPPTTEELIEFVRLFARGTDPSLLGAEALNTSLSSRGIRSVELLERLDRKSVARQEAATGTASPRETALKTYVKAVDVVKECAARIHQSQGLETRKAKRLVYNLVDLCLDEGLSFMGLANIKNYDEYTYNHSVNVCVIAIEFGKNLGLTKKQLGELGVAALFHDYGKLAIPRDILNKPGRFEPEEWEVMKSHPLKAVKALLSIQGFQKTDIRKMIAAFEHHRNYDCTGYPQTGLNKPMNFYSKVVAIADAYDAMTTNRVYQRALLPTAALKILLDNAGTKFDPLLVKAFINTVGIYPVGTLLRLKSGEMAVVTSANSDPAKLSLPTLRLIRDAAGKPVEGRREIDLSSLPSAEIDTVLRPEEHKINVAHYLFQEP